MNMAGTASAAGEAAAVAPDDSSKAAKAPPKTRAKTTKAANTAKTRKPAAAPKADSASEAQDKAPEAAGGVAAPDSNRTDSASAAAAPGDTATPPPPAPATLVFDYPFMEQRSQEIHPILMEKKLEIDKAEQRMHELEMGAILPKFQIETGIGPAPGLRNVRDSLAVLPGNTSYVIQNQKEFDFEDWGPFFGIEMTIAQPLNLSRYRAGHRAAAASIKVSEAAFQKEKVDVSEDAQKLYFQRVYAGQMLSVLKDATKELDRAQKKIEGLLDDGDQSVKQSDLLEMKAGRYTLEKARNEAALGVARAELGLRFLMQVPDSLSLVPKDSVLSLRPETFPSLDSLKMLTLLNHPDLKRLANGLAARRELVRVAKGEIGPDIFLFGTFKYTKAWSTDRQSGGEDPFARDPLNELTGVGGLGMRLNLNFWSRLEKVRKEKIELAQLERTETYAARGLVLKMQDEYIQLLNCRANVTESQKSLRSAEAWLKGAALKYDLDPSTAKDILSPYKTVIGAKRDYFEAVLNYNLAVSRVIKSIGWTLTDYIHNLKPNG
jgi:outer membrane protein TolC